MKRQATITNNLSRAISTGLGLGYFLACQIAVAGPSGWTNTHGNASAATNGSHTEVTQSTARAVMEWDNFDLAETESVNFTMADTDAILNIVKGPASSILGDITSSGNGQVFLVNNNGITFGSGSTVSVGSFVASSLTMDPDEFFAGNYTFAADPTNKGTIINNGLIKAAMGGTVALIGNSVINQGQITAIQGKAVLATGEAMTLSFDSDGLMQFEITQAVSSNIDGLESAIMTGPTSSIQGQEIVLEAHVAANVFTNAINHTGAIRANQFGTGEGGTVWLIADGATLFESDSSLTEAHTPQHITRVENLPEPPVEPEPPVDPPEPPVNPGPPVNPEPPVDPEPPMAQTPELDDNTLNASALDPATNTDIAAAATSSLGIYNVEAPGIKLPADQREEEL